MILEIENKGVVVLTHNWSVDGGTRHGEGCGVDRR
jgi:hypothetical protein